MDWRDWCLFLSWGPCSNCGVTDRWRLDQRVRQRSGQLRLYCECGEDVWVGGYVRPEVTEALGEGPPDERPLGAVASESHPCA